MIVFYSIKIIAKRGGLKTNISKLIGCIAAILMLLTSSVMAFPLSGGNDAANATVFAAMKEGNTIVMDIAVGVSTLYDSPENVDLELVDDEDRRYSNSFVGDWVGGYKNGAARRIIKFDVPSGAAIKRLRVIPTFVKTAEPFSIDWTGLPEISSDNATLKFYGVTKPSVKLNAFEGWVWVFDVKISNTGNETLNVKSDEFQLVDQFGWKYDGYLDSNRDEKILPGETLRYTVNVNGVSEFSRPVFLKFKDMKLDISAWA